MGRDLDISNFDDNGYLIRWDGLGDAVAHAAFPDTDLRSTGDISAARLPNSALGADLIELTFGSSSAATQVDIQLVAYDRKAGVVVGIIPGTSAAPDPPRQKDAADSAGVFVHQSLQFDVRGLPQKTDVELYVVLVDSTIDSTSEDIEMLHFRVIQDRPT